MKALLALKSATNQSSLFAIIALIIIAPLVLPHLAAAAELQTLGQPADFQIKISDSSVLNPTPKSNDTQHSLSIDTIKQSDPLTADLQAYLENHNSPLKNYTSQLLEHDNWKTVLAISFVESNLCQHNLRYNCSGIGGPGHFRQYNDLGEWVNDMSTLLDAHYNGWTLDKMNGVYVQPKSTNWGYGSKKILSELTVLEEQAESERRDLAQIQNQNVRLTTFSEVALNN
jgi:hypothetical protein